MSTTLSSRSALPTGYRMEQLAAAFDRIMNPRDWQAPIFAVIPADERPLIEEAVVRFTGAPPVFAPAPGAGDQLLVTSRGYRLGRAVQSPQCEAMAAGGAG